MLKINDKQLNADKERVYSLARTFIGVHEPRQMEYVLKYQINAIFNLESSTIICTKVSGNAKDYLFYLPNDFSRLVNPSVEYSNPQVVNTDTDKYLFDFLEKANDKEIYSKLDLENYVEGNELHPYLMAYHQRGGKYAYAVHLVRNNAILGFWLLLPAEGSVFSFNQELLEPMIAQLASTVHNISLSAELADKKREGEILLLLNRDLTASPDKNQLLNLIRNRLQKLFKFSHHFVCRINDDANTFSLLLSDSQSRSQYHPFYESAKNSKFPISDGIMNRVLLSSEPVVFDLVDLAEKGPLPLHLQVNYDSGISRVVMLALRVNAEIQGVWTIAFTAEQRLNPKILELIKSVSAPISIAVANILSHEDLKRRDLERELLLALSEDIAAVRDTDNLIGVIKKRLKTVLRFSHFALCIKDQDYSFISFVSDPNSKAKNHPSYTKILRQYKESCQEIVEFINQASGPIVFNPTNIVRFPEIPEVMRVNFESGNKEIAIIKLSDGNSIPGYCFFFYDQPNLVSSAQFGLLKGVASQFSTAVHNIKANLEISNREKENELLISLSNTTAGIRSFDQLMNFIDAKFKNVFAFHSSLIGMHSEEGSSLHIRPSGSTSFTGSELSAGTDLRTIPFGAELQLQVLKSNTPILLDLQTDHHSLLQSLPAGYDYPYAVMTKMTHAGQLLGIWLLFYQNTSEIDNRLFRLLQGINDQLSNCVANILANEKLAYNEMQKGMLLSLSKNITKARNSSDLISTVAQDLKATLKFYHTNIIIFNEDRSHFHPWVLESEVKAKGQREYDSINQLTLIDAIMRAAIDSPEILQLVDLHALAASERMPDYYRVNYESGINYIINIRLIARNEPIGFWNLCFVDKPDFNPKYLELVQEIGKIMSTTISNITFNDIIQKQLLEINRYKERLEEEKIYLKQEIETTHNYAEIIGEGKEIKNVFHMVSQVAEADTTVLILGETGTGKELIARAIHNNSPRKNKLLVKVNCAALPANLIESELFGHEKGSFTGATERRVGKFELANGGSLFLDEVGEMPPELQVKLLRALQEREIERVGGKGPIKVDVRIIAATNRNLEQEMIKGNFRSDLYFRLSTFPIYLPPLRDRREDIPLLAAYFVSRFTKKSGKAIDGISQRAMQELMRYNWPGNIRELEHQVERSVLMTQGNTIQTVFLTGAGPVITGAGPETMDDVFTARTIDENERELILRTLRYCEGKVSGPNGAAHLLGVPSTTLNAKMKRLHIKKNFSR